MAAGDAPPPELSAAMIAEAARAMRGTITTDGNVAALLGFTYAPGDLVRDRKTGLTGRVLHAVHYTIVRHAART